MTNIRLLLAFCSVLLTLSACQKELHEPTIEDYIDQIIGTYQGKYTHTSSAPPNINTYNEENDIMMTVEKVNNSNSQIRCFRSGHNFSQEYILETLEIPITYRTDDQTQQNEGATRFYMEENRLELNCGSGSPGGGWLITFSGTKIN